jgi:hypothetical protein
MVSSVNLINLYIIEIMTDNEDYNRGIRERMRERDEKLELELDTDFEDEELCLSAVTPINATSPHILTSTSKDVNAVNAPLSGLLSTEEVAKTGSKRRRPLEVQPAIPDQVHENQAHHMLRRSKRLRKTRNNVK